MGRAGRTLEVLLASWLAVAAPLLDVDFPVVWEDPAPGVARSSYFGYSLLLHPGAEPGDPSAWLQAGAPRANDSARSPAEPGRVFRCPIRGPCRALSVDLGKDGAGAWLGGAMALHRLGDVVAVCAHRWRRKKSPVSAPGACFAASASLENFTLVAPLDNDKYWNYAEKSWGGGRVSDYRFGQAGASVVLPDEGEDPVRQVRLAAGAPGVLNWRGSSFHAEEDSADRHRFRGAFLNAVVPFKTSHTSDGYYLGYSIAAGKFFADGKLSFAAGGPRGNLYRGMVMVFRYPTTSRSLPEVRHTLEGETAGSYFGASLASGDMNGDGRHDLLVGAPLGAEPRVYLFLGGDPRLQPPARGPSYLRGSAALGLASAFGTALAVADLDGDGYGDALVGAPEAEGGGALLVYRGGPQGLRSGSAVLQLLARDFPVPGLRGFGISIAPPVDVDGNGHPDVAVGAHKSGHAVLLRTCTRIELLASLSGPPRLERNDQSLVLTACLGFRGREGTVISVTARLGVDAARGRAYPRELRFQVEALSSGKNFCKNITAAISVGASDVLVPLEVSLRAIIQEKVPHPQASIVRSDGSKEGDDIYDPWRPTQRDEAVAHLRISFISECGELACRPDLHAYLSLPDVGNASFILGSADALRLNITVSNFGRATARVTARLRLEADLTRLPATCRDSPPDSVLCDLAPRLDEGASTTLMLEVDARAISLTAAAGDRLAFSVDVESDGEDLHPEDDRAELFLLLAVDVAIVVAGKAIESEISEPPDGGPAPFKHMYEVQSVGASPAEDVTLTVLVPYAVVRAGRAVTFASYGEPLGYLAGRQINCEVEAEAEEEEEEEREEEEEQESGRARRQGAQAGQKLPSNRTLWLRCGAAGVRCRRLSCAAGRLERGGGGGGARLLLAGLLDARALGGLGALAGGLDVLALESAARAEGAGGARAEARARSVLVLDPPPARVAVWVPAVAVAVGLLLLLMLSMGLVKAGFFKRTKKDELEALKHDEAQERESIAVYEEIPMREDDLECDDQGSPENFTSY